MTELESEGRQRDPVEELLEEFLEQCRNGAVELDVICALARTRCRDVKRFGEWRSTHATGSLAQARSLEGRKPKKMRFPDALSIYSGAGNRYSLVHRQIVGLERLAVSSAAFQPTNCSN